MFHQDKNNQLLCGYWDNKIVTMPPMEIIDEEDEEKDIKQWIESREGKPVRIRINNGDDDPVNEIYVMFSDPDDPTSGNDCPINFGDWYPIEIARALGYAGTQHFGGHTPLREHPHWSPDTDLFPVPDIPTNGWIWVHYYFNDLFYKCQTSDTPIVDEQGDYGDEGDTIVDIGLTAPQFNPHYFVYWDEEEGYWAFMDGFDGDLSQQETSINKQITEMEQEIIKKEAYIVSSTANNRIIGEMGNDLGILLCQVIIETFKRLGEWTPKPEIEGTIKVEILTKVMNEATRLGLPYGDYIYLLDKYATQAQSLFDGIWEMHSMIADGHPDEGLYNPERDKAFLTWVFFESLGSNTTDYNCIATYEQYLKSIWASNNQPHDKGAYLTEDEANHILDVMDCTIPDEFPTVEVGIAINFGDMHSRHIEFAGDTVPIEVNQREKEEFIKNWKTRISRVLRGLEPQAVRTPKKANRR